jgi:GMP synthase (glutamine-hydrolysing)
MHSGERSKATPARAMRRLGENLSPFVEVSGDVDAVISAALSATNCDIIVVRVCEGEPLCDVREFSAVLISGSPAMVSDPYAWIKHTAMGPRNPHLSSPDTWCLFGHQLIVHALGGKVARTAGSAEFNTAMIERTATDAEDRFLSFLPRKFLAQAAH